MNNNNYEKACGVCVSNFIWNINAHLSAQFCQPVGYAIFQAKKKEKKREEDVKQQQQLLSPRLHQKAK